MRNSDRAMYLAKRKGRARHELFAGPGAIREAPAEEAPVEEPAIEEEAMTAEAAADTAIIEQAEAAPLDDGYETPATPEPAPEPPREAAPGEEPLPSAASLSEARRRRRLRFPPRG
jgi:hypothetical protein